MRCAGSKASRQTVDYLCPMPHLVWAKATPWGIYVPLDISGRDSSLISEPVRVLHRPAAWHRPESGHYRSMFILGRE